MCSCRSTIIFINDDGQRHISESSEMVLGGRRSVVARFTMLRAQLVDSLLPHAFRHWRNIFLAEVPYMLKTRACIVAHMVPFMPI